MSDGRKRARRCARARVGLNLRGRTGRLWHDCGEQSLAQQRAARVVDELLSDIPAGDVRARRVRINQALALLEFRIRRRRLGPCPAVWRTPPDPERHYWLHEYLVKLETWADNADARVRELAAEAELFMAMPTPSEPIGFLMAIGEAARTLQGDPRKSNRANAIELAGDLDLTSGELKWIFDYIDLLAERLQSTDKILHRGFYASLRVMAAVLAHVSDPAIMVVEPSVAAELWN